MALNYHPAVGTIVICDFSAGFKSPEITKRRPVIIISPRFRERDNLCTVVPLSTTPPPKVMPYHYKLFLEQPLPAPYDAPFHWVKTDMVYTACFERMSLMFVKKEDGERVYDNRVIDTEELKLIQKCLLNAIGLAGLTAHF